METLLKYMKQKTTWAGLLSVAGAFGVVIQPELAEEIIATGMAIAGLVAVLFDEKK